MGSSDTAHQHFFKKEMRLTQTGVRIGMMKMITSLFHSIRSKLAWKMTLIYVGIVFVPSIMIGTFYYQTVKNYLITEKIDLTQRTLDQYCEDIDANLVSAEKVSLQLQQHANFMRFLRGEYASKGNQISLYVSELSTMFLYSFFSSRYIQDIKVYMVNDSLLEMGEFLLNIKKDASLAKEHNNLLDGGYWSYHPDTRSVVYRKAIKSVYAAPMLGVLEVTCRDDILLDSLISLENEDRKIVLIHEGLFMDLNGKPAVLKEDSISVTGVLNRIPVRIRVDSIPSSANHAMTVTLLISVGCFMLLSLLLFFVLYRLSLRITRFSRSMSDYLHKQPQVYVDHGHDELSQLVSTYNNMVENNDFLLNQVKIEVLHQQETEYRALQSQIDPHFIYNSLENIRMMATMFHDVKVAAMIFSLSKLMRYIFLTTEKEVSIGQELDYIREYIKIQKMRMGEKIQLKIVCDGALKEQKCPKFAIQPMVENAVKYGFGPENESVDICLSIERMAEIMHIQVNNTGQGIPEDVLVEMNRRLQSGDTLQGYSSGNGIGLENINKRMRHLHKDSFVMQLRNTDTGVAVDMSWRLPL